MPHHGHPRSLEIIRWGSRHSAKPFLTHGHMCQRLNVKGTNMDTPTSTSGSNHVLHDTAGRRIDFHQFQISCIPSHSTQSLQMQTSDIRDRAPLTVAGRMYSAARMWTASHQSCSSSLHPRRNHKTSVTRQTTASMLRAGSANEQHKQWRPSSTDTFLPNTAPS